MKQKPTLLFDLYYLKQGIHGIYHSNNKFNIPENKLLLPATLAICSTHKGVLTKRSEEYQSNPEELLRELSQSRNTGNSFLLFKKSAQINYSKSTHGKYTSLPEIHRQLNGYIPCKKTSFLFHLIVFPNEEPEKIKQKLDQLLLR